MSEIIQAGKRAKNDDSQESWDSNVPELICKDLSLDDDSFDTDVFMEPSAAQDMDIKGIMSRKGKGGLSKNRQRTTTIKPGRGKGDEMQAARKDLEKIEEKEDVLLGSWAAEEKEAGKQGGAKPEPEMKTNNNQLQVQTTMERQVEGCDKGTDA